MRGFDIRSVSPRDAISGVQVGGNKSLLFNAEYLIHIAGPVRLVLFYDAGQVRNIGERVRVEGADYRAVQPGTLVPTLVDLDFGTLRSPLIGLPLPLGTEDAGGDERVQDVDGRRDSLLHAGAERAVPVDFCDESVAHGRARQ